MKKIINYILFTSSLILIGINSTYAAGMCVSCGTDVLPIPYGIPKFVSNLITLVQVAVPILIIVINMIHYVKAVGNGEDKVIRETNLKFIRSIIAGVAIFLLVAIVRFAFGNLLGTTGNETLSCISCFIDSDTCEITYCLTRPGDENEENTIKKTCEMIKFKSDCEDGDDYGAICKWENGKCSNTGMYAK